MLWVALFDLLEDFFGARFFWELDVHDMQFEACSSGFLDLAFEVAADHVEESGGTWAKGQW